MNYTPNSHRYKEEQAEKKKVEKVISGTAKRKQKSGTNKLVDTFISEDASSVKNYILMDVLVPAIKNALADIIINGVNMTLFGDTKRSSSGRRSASDRVSYNKYYRDDDRPASSAIGNRISYDFDDVVLDTRGEAEEVLSSMDDLLATYNAVTVADMYDLVGTSCNYTDNKYGWTNLRNAEIVRVRDGYKIKMPKAIPLD